MKKIFSGRSWDDDIYWKKNDTRMLEKVNELIEDTDRNQHEGIGKPEPLRHPLSGFWSRRINEEHRLVYRIVEDEIHIAQIRYHY